MPRLSVCRWSSLKDHGLQGGGAGLLGHISDTGTSKTVCLPPNIYTLVSQDEVKLGEKDVVESESPSCSASLLGLEDEGQAQLN